MPDYPKLPIITPGNGDPFPELPVITPGTPRASNREKYGSLYYLGIGGLMISVALVANFAYGLWATRDFWAAILVLNDARRPESERVRAAWLVAHHPTANDRQRSDLALIKDLPRLARYILAESLTSEAIRADPKGYAQMVARSEAWPDWLRLLMARPMAYGVVEGYRIPWEPLDLLREHQDPAIALWATYTRAAMAPGDAPALRALQQAAIPTRDFAPLAAILQAAAQGESPARVSRLNEATTWLRTHHPEALRIWEGWVEKDGQILETPARGSPGG